MDIVGPNIRLIRVIPAAGGYILEIGGFPKTYGMDEVGQLCFDLAEYLKTPEELHMDIERLQSKQQ